jgi:thioesterase domain-containing protein
MKPGQEGNIYFQKTGKEELLPGNLPKSLIPAKTGGNKTPLYIVCGGGGTVFKFEKFIEMLDADQPVYVLQQPTDLQDLAEFPSDIKGIAARYISEILDADSKGPYALSGHCIGGIIVFEMAKQMQAMGKTVTLVAMFDTIVRETEMPEQSAFGHLYYKTNRMKVLFSKVYKKIQFETYLLRNHSKHAIRYKVNAIKSLLNRIVPNKIYKEQNVEFEGFTRLKYALGTAYGTYQMTPSELDIVVFYAKDRYHFVDKDNNIRYKRFGLSDSVKNRWKEYVRSATFYEIEGEHSTMFDPNHGGEQLARNLQQYLDKCHVKWQEIES